MHKQIRILRYLLDHGEQYGLELIKAGLGKRGTIYVTLGQMEDADLIKSRKAQIPVKQRKPWHQPDQTRRVYSISDHGRKHLAQADTNRQEYAELLFKHS